MEKLRLIAITSLALGLLAPNAMAQRKGGAVSSGVRGAMVGGLVGGDSGAATGAKIGAVAGATRTVAQSADQRRAVDAEAQARAQYQASPQYQNAPHSNFAEAPPQVMGTSSSPGSTAPGAAASIPKKDEKPVETVISKEGKPVLGITFPSDWKRKIEDRRVSAVSADSQGWSVIALLDGVKDKQAGIAKAKEGLEKSLKDIKYDEPTETERGALVVTGTGKGKKVETEVVFAIGVFESGPGQIAGAAFIVDQDVEEHYKETVRYICGTIRGEKDIAAAKSASK